MLHRSAPPIFNRNGNFRWPAPIWSFPVGALSFFLFVSPLSPHSRQSVTPADTPLFHDAFICATSGMIFSSFSDLNLPVNTPGKKLYCTVDKRRSSVLFQFLSTKFTIKNWISLSYICFGPHFDNVFIFQQIVNICIAESCGAITLTDKFIFWM